MLTLDKVTSAESAATYYEGADDYYSEDGRAPSSWWGEGAVALGLVGSVRPDEFRRVLEGRLPDGSTLHHGGEGPRTAGIDLTFSAPKSLSLQAMVGGDHRLLQAHRDAVTATLKHVESTIAAYRVTLGGETVLVRSGNLVVARFDHELSRDKDPQLHTHCVLVNATQRQDGQWRALSANDLYAQQKLLGVHYRAELAAAVQALGYAVRRTHEDGRFELAHINDAQVSAFSTRRQAIDAALAARGRNRQNASAREREIASLNTRRSKDKQVDRAALAQAWQSKAAEFSIDWTAIPPSTLAVGQRETSANEAVHFAVAHLTERNAVVSRTTLVQVALAHGTGLALFSDIEGAINTAIAKESLISSPDGRLLTTAQAQTTEREMLAVEQRGRGLLPQPIQQSPTARTRLATQNLSQGQRSAAELILSTKHRVVGVQGLAGTGKTTMLRQVKANLGSFKALGLAPSAAAARELEATGIPSMTTAAFLARNAQGLTANTLVVLDEAGMVSARDMHLVLQAVEKAGARAVLVGDTRQLKAVEAGAPFSQLQRAGMETARMAEIQRQAEGPLREAVLDAAEGRIAASVAKLKSSIAEVPHATERYERIARHYASLPPGERMETLMVAGTNVARTRINELVRHRLALAGTGLVVTALERRDLTRAQAQSSLSYSPGDLVQAERHYQSIGLMRGDLARVVAAEPGCVTLERADGVKVYWRPTTMSNVTAYVEVERELAVGDLVRFTKNDYSQGIVNGQRGQVESVGFETREIHVRTDGGVLVTLDAAEPLQIDHGYCTTVHAAQGQTCQRVLVDADVSSAMANQALYYVAISRARSEAVLYTDDRELLPEAMSRLDTKHAALDIDLRTPREHALSI
ncbi:MobF family relaxase [uncultured Ramlibacter sp.]|uniref:MobF family relaxase n=1 Tax=uncultured Ramlibacter sp. TaxID=260755 RepID=UPI0026024978|nr:MobF family relaxase [uncultured Ramlibacter sp.]